MKYILVLCLALVGASGCTGTRAAYSSADTIDEYAFVLTEHYAALVNQSANIVESPTTPELSKRVLRQAESRVNEVMVGTPEAPGVALLARAYRKGGADPTKLQEAIDTAIVRLADFVRAIRGVVK